jgi:hypothetical protein
MAGETGGSCGTRTGCGPAGERALQPSWCDEGGRPRSSNGSTGRVRGGLEAWLNTQEDLPEVLVSSARVLADELDAASDSSPLWGRYTLLMQALTEPQYQALAFNAEVRALYEEFATIEAAEHWRHRRYLKAVDDGEPHPQRWTKLVPLAARCRSTVGTSGAAPTVRGRVWTAAGASRTTASSGGLPIWLGRCGGGAVSSDALLTAALVILAIGIARA